MDVSDSDEEDEREMTAIRNAVSQIVTQRDPFFDSDDSDTENRLHPLNDSDTEENPLYPPRPMVNCFDDQEECEDIDAGWVAEAEDLGPCPDIPEGPSGRLYTQEPFSGYVHCNVEGTNPEDFFNAMFDDSMWGEICAQMNAYAEKRKESLGSDAIARSDHPDYKKHSRLNFWKAIDCNDLRIFVAHLIILGLIRKPDLESYWTCGSTMSTPFFGKYMSRNRFTGILSNIHLADDSDNPRYGQDGHNALAKIQPFVDMMDRNFRHMYKPKRDLSMDEGCCPWKGRLRFKQYNPRKPCRFHIKLFLLSESESGYVVAFQVYTGKGSCADAASCSLPNCSTTTQTVMTLAMQGRVLDKGHHLYFDNYYTSPELANELLMRATQSCGTSRMRKGLPVVMKEKRKMQNGESLY